jgi:hypothetical protein
MLHENLLSEMPLRSGISLAEEVSASSSHVCQAQRRSSLRKTQQISLSGSGKGDIKLYNILAFVTSKFLEKLWLASKIVF